MNKNVLLYAAILVFGLAAPFVFPAFKVQLSILCVLIVLATTWNIQGGEMGYNTFGNILFYGLGMYLCASVQVGMFFPLAEWTESGGEKTFVHTPTQFFQGMAAGLVVAAIVPTIVAGLIGYAILGLRGHYFAICSIVSEQLSVDAGEVKADSNFQNDLGADSLDTVELVMALEEAFDIEIPDEAAEGIATVGDAVKFIEEKKG